MASQSTYTPIATVSPSGSTSTISFSSIPATYTDLVLVVYGRTTAAVTTQNCTIRFNGDYSTSYSWTQLNGNGSSATSNRASSTQSVIGDINGSSTTSGIFCAININIFNYANTTTYKSYLSRSATDLNGSGTTIETVGLWRNTGAITLIELFPSSGNWVSGSMATLYGITAA